jgi:hypothetical protein
MPRLARIRSDENIRPALCFHVLSLLDRNAKRVRSRQISCERLTWRCGRSTCWRSSMLCSTSSGVLRARSMAAFRA